MSKASLRIAVAYRGIPHSRGWATGDNLVRAFRRLGHEVFPYGNYYKTPERLELQPLPEELDLLVYCECNDDEPQYHELRAQRARARVYWDFDVDNGRQGVTTELVRSIGFDLVCHANKIYGEFFGKLAPRTLSLPYAFDDEHFFPTGRAKMVDVAIIGSPYPQRRAYVARLEKLGAKVVFINGKRQETFVEAINDLKIHLNLNIYGPGGTGLLVGRVWETIGCGTFLLTQRKDFIEDFFEDGVHVALFDSEVECAEKIRYYLEDEKERDKIARAGYELGLERHTYVARAEEILSQVEDLLDRPPRRGPLSRRDRMNKLLGWLSS